MSGGMGVVTPMVMQSLRSSPAPSRALVLRAKDAASRPEKPVLFIQE